MYLAELFARNNNPVTQTSLFILKSVRNNIKFNFNKNSSILELGTGDGGNTIKVLQPLLPKDYKELVLSDKSPEMLEYAKKMPEFSKVRFEQLDIESDNIPKDFKERFDYVFSFMMFHFITDTRKSLHNIHSMLKPGGKTYNCFVIKNPLDHAWAQLGKHPKWSKYDPNPFVSIHYNKTNIYEMYQEYLRDCGFKNIILHPVTYAPEFSSEEEWKNLTKAANLSVNKIPEELLEEYLEDYYNLLKKDESWSVKKTEKGDVITVSADMLAIHANK